MSNTEDTTMNESTLNKPYIFTENHRDGFLTLAWFDEASMLTCDRKTLLELKFSTLEEIERFSSEISMAVSALKNYDSASNTKQV